MAMKRISPTSVDKTLRMFMQMSKCFSSSSNTLSVRKDGQSDGVAVSAPSAEKGLNSGYVSAPSQNFTKPISGPAPVSNLITPNLKQIVEQSASSASASQQRTGESQGKVGNPIIQPTTQDARRDMSSAGGATEKLNASSLKTNLDHAPVNSQQTQDDASLLASRRVDPSTVRQVYYFDTLAFAKKLEAKGFTREQAEGCAESLVEIINTTLDHQSRHMVTKPQQEIAVLQLMSEIVSVKKDMTLLQKSEFSSLKTETEKISIELSQVQGHMNDEIVKLKGQFSLDINLERGRAIEAHAENEKKLQQLHNKIETEIANLRTIYEVYRNDVFKYAGGTVIAVGGLMLGVIRLWH